MPTPKKEDYIPKNEWKDRPPSPWMKARRYEDEDPFPVLSTNRQIPSDPERQVLLALFAEICNGWRALTDVRFRLLGLLPIVSIAVAISVLSRDASGGGLSPHSISAVAIFGFLVTCALWAYDFRNTQLYNDLVGRGRQIESDLGIHTGHFRGRPNATLVSHDVAIGAVYLLAAGFWLYIAVVPWFTSMLEMAPPIPHALK